MKVGKWDEKLPLIREMAGKHEAAEIASRIGTTVNNLHKICHRNGIKLPRDPATYTGRPRRDRRTDIEQAIELLERNGYTVNRKQIPNERACWPIIESI
jgi:hypothetical protein